MAILTLYFKDVLKASYYHVYIIKRWTQQQKWNRIVEWTTFDEIISENFTSFVPDRKKNPLNIWPLSLTLTLGVVNAHIG